MEESLQSLMNGLRLVWIISRHYKTEEKMKNLMSTISNEIADKVQKDINIQVIFKLKDDKAYSD